MSKLIIICGLGGAGKTNIGNPEIESFNYSTMPGQKINVTTNIPIEETIKIILDEIR